MAVPAPRLPPALDLAVAGRTELSAPVTAFELEDVRARRMATGRPYLEFVRTNDLSFGLYELPAGGVDPQSPHTEDEVYYIVRGAATIRVGSAEHPVGPGSIIFVPAAVVHRFHDIEEDLVVVVAFGPAEASRQGAVEPA